jgi:hypothetical protein
MFNTNYKGLKVTKSMGRYHLMKEAYPGSRVWNPILSYATKDELVGALESFRTSHGYDIKVQWGGFRVPEAVKYSTLVAGPMDVEGMYKRG